ncbi:hypothetical protein GB864_08585 [Agromyces sp. MMS17-SY077]|uniref:HMA domain-containing protein n=2 Tax=Agromyces seonyuensis TaxID=2662446 RepID=A0A6I4NWP5_9MICO|nr:hypothetical protein [Agromyces seonyuensis]
MCGGGGHGAASETVFRDGTGSSGAPRARARVLAELPDAVVAEYDLTGLTCDNCVRHVTEEFVSLDGVQTVDVRLVVGGVSTVRVKADELLDPTAVAAAVDEAGYVLA